MSGFMAAAGKLGPGASALGGLANTALQMVGIIPSRNIGGIIADCTVQEQHRDDMITTDHPVEQGAAITDHAYARPPEITLHVLWSNSSQVSNMASGLLSGNLPSISSIFGLFTEGYAASVYARLIALQKSAVPMTIVTGKRTYRNMILTSVMQTTTNKSEYALDVTITAKQIIIVSVTTTTQAAGTQASPQNTAAPANTGAATPTPVAKPAAALPGPAMPVPPVPPSVPPSNLAYSPSMG